MKTKLKGERGWRGIRTRNLERERPRVDHNRLASPPEINRLKTVLKFATY